MTDRLVQGDGTDEEMKSDHAYQRAFLNANGKTYYFKIRAKLDSYNEIQRVRHQALSASPLDYRAECAKLASSSDSHNQLTIVANFVAGGYHQAVCSGLMRRPKVRL